MMNPTVMAAQTGQSNLQLVEAELQWTIWSMSGLGSTSNPYPNWTGYFYNQAATHYGSVTGSWEILTPKSGTGYPNQLGYYGQEFMIALPAPEPSSILVLLASLTALAVPSSKIKSSDKRQRL